MNSIDRRNWTIPKTWDEDRKERRNKNQFLRPTVRSKSKNQYLPSIPRRLSFEYGGDNVQVGTEKQRGGRLKHCC